MQILRLFHDVERHGERVVGAARAQHSGGFRGRDGDEGRLEGDDELGSATVDETREDHGGG